MPSSLLETIPHDVLQHIAFLLAMSSDIAETPHHLACLLLTSSQICRSLDVRNCPHLYANIFRTTFDVDGRLHSRLTDSALAVELFQRYRILRRIRRQDALTATLGELWAALRMILEDEGRNGQYLSTAGFLKFVLSLVNGRRQTDKDQVNALCMWLLCLSLTRKDITEMSEATRERLRRSLRFPITLPPAPSGHFTHFSDRLNGLKDLTADYFSAAIIITFALNEAVPLAVPPHLPQTRAIAVATQRTGPTIEDFRFIANHRTPLFADVWMADARSGADLPVSYHTAMHDPELYRLLHASYSVPDLPTRRGCTPGSLSGVWEGSFMLSGPTNDATMNCQPPSAKRSKDFQCLKPMQCAVSEYLCFPPHIPLPSDYPAELLESAIQSGRYGYEKYSAGSSNGNGVLVRPRDPRQALDVLIVGETLRDHEQAWGGFRFAGRLRSDGVVVLLKEPKDQIDRDCLGVWTLEARLWYGSALVGQMRSGSARDVRGIFSLHKPKATS